MKRLQILQKLVHKKFYEPKIATVDLSKTYFLKNTNKPNNCNLNCDWTIYPQNYENFKNSNPRVQIYWLLQKKEYNHVQLQEVTQKFW